MTLPLYLGRMFLLRFLAAWLALAALADLVAVMETSDEILARGLGGVGVARYALLRLPMAAVPVVPIAALAAALFTFAALAWRAEVAAMRACGIAVARMAVWLLPAAAAVGLVSFFLADRVMPEADAALAAWWRATDPAPPRSGGRVWFRAGLDVVGIGRVDGDGTTIGDMVLYLRSADGVLDAVATAPTAHWRDGAWLLRDGTIQPAGATAIPFETLPWQGAVTPANLLELERDQPALSVAGMAGILHGQRAGADSPQAYRLRLVRAFAQPFAPMVMVLLATPVAGGLRRGGGIAAGMAVGLAAGLSYLVLDGILAALGEVGTLPALMAVWLPHAVFAAIGGAMLLYAEG